MDSTEARKVAYGCQIASLHTSKPKPWLLAAKRWAKKADKLELREPVDFKPAGFKKLKHG